MGFWIQYKALLYKNWILWKRKLFGSLCELLFPIVLMIVLGLIRQTTPPEFEDAQSFSDQRKDSFYVSPEKVAGLIPFTKCFIDKSTTLKYSIISEDSAFVDYMKDGISRLTGGSIGKDKHKEFESISKFEDFITGSDYEDDYLEKLCFGVYLKKKSNSDFELRLRYNITETIFKDSGRLGDFVDIFNLESNKAYNDLIVFPSEYLEDFYDYGFLSLMNLADNYFLQQKNEDGKIEAQFYPMRFDDYIEDGFLTGLGNTLVFFIIIAFLIPVCRFLSALVSDKENRTKEMMMMMGLHSSAYWLSWITYYFAVYTVICIIITIVSTGMGIFKYSNGGLIFLYFWLFAISCITFSMLLSVFFSKSRSALLVGVPLFIGTYFISFAVSDPLITMNKKAGASLLPCVAFSVGTNVITNLETGQIGIQTSNPDYEIANFSHGLYFTMIIIDIVYMALLTFYLEAVWPTEWGVKQPWYFLCTKNFWCPRKVKVDEELNLNKKIDWGDAVEPVDEILEAQKSSGKAMIVRGLGKKFSNKVAVDGLNLDIYQGQIFALLGHNGAGKTTTLSMLTGLIPPSSGEMTVNGNLLSKNLDSIRENLGVCPQQNILFPDLTPMEHMSLFCKFKGMNDSEEIKQLSEQKLAELELTPKKDTLSKFLSGGQKRKLQLALALVGNSSIVLLDEPTSGMDLTARRHVWDTLKNNKTGKIIILTTHYMEEADVLADRIAIMSQGNLRCCGSSFFLKSRYGVGYYLTIVRNQDAIKNTKAIDAFVNKYIDGAKLMSDSHAEVTFQLPSSNSDRFPKFFKHLDKRFTEFGLISYSMSATTLEEVFLKVARGDHELENVEDPIEGQENSPMMEGADFALVKDKEEGGMFFKHSVALFKKRALSTLRDKKTLLFEIFIPILLIIIGLALMLIPSFLKTYSAYELKMSRYSSTQNVFYAGDSDGYRFVKAIPDIKERYVDTSDIETFSDTLFDKLDLQPKIVASFFFNSSTNANSDIYSIGIFTDQKAFQSYPTAYTTITNQILKKAHGNDFNLKVYNHPMPITDEMNEVSSSGDGFLGSLIFSLGFSFIPTGIVLFITKEREFNVKHQHMISGVSLSAYWFSNFLWDLLKHVLPAIICSLIILAFNISIYTDDDSDYGAMWVLMILGGICQAPFSYMFSFFFKSHSTAQVVMLLLSFITGSVFPSAVFVMFIFENSRDAGKALSWILKIFPNFCFGWGVLSIGSKRALAAFDKRDEPYDSFDINSAGGCMLLIGIFAVLYFFIVIILELFETNPVFARCLGGKKNPIEEAYEHDDDVDKEAEVANRTDPAQVQVNVKDLCKSYSVQGRLFTAVNKISFNVEPEQCFALLGVNGAGKTTTFKILTGEIFSDQGSAFIGGYNVSKQLPKVRNLIGYCPQFDAISDLLTGEEHLELYANIKGIPKHRIQEQVNYMLKNMDLEQYRNVLAGTFSGGNKRKLSVAMALIGNPSVVFLDEPSAGMDPEARKKMWKILGSIKKQKSAVILTTHSMEEAEALCDRMTIMVRGRFKCIGSSSWIKNKYGDGYEIEVKVEPPPESYIMDYIKNFDNVPNSHMGISINTAPQALEKIGFQYLLPLIKPVGPGAGIYNTMIGEGYVSKEAFSTWCLIENLGKHVENWLRNELQYVEVIEHYHLMFKFKIKKDNVKSIGELFSIIEKNKAELKISDYAISMPSLEQIFNRFAKQAEFEELAIMNQQQK